ncbi:hypothetical protein niasHT_009718 [Heterodera trifolii]|uniref:Uncharacterized protein n=1 Tax=Heterodera trifolii TaxID=157864 RepID=A0ABD2MDK8_9BILA
MGMDQLRDRDICRLWALNQHIKTFQDNVTKFCEMLALGDGALLKNDGPFNEPKECVRLNRIRKSNNANDKKWLANFEQELTEIHYIALENLLEISKNTNFGTVPVRKLADIFANKKAIWENELTFRLRMVVFLKNDLHPIMKTLIKDRIYELFGEKNAEITQQLYDKYPSLTYGIGD